MNPIERLEELEALIEELVERNRETPAIVEGRRDLDGLRELGLEGPIIILNTGRAVFETCEAITAEHDEAIILTDWDRRGGQLCRLLRQGLEANGTAYDTDFRARLARLSKKETRDIEGLPGFLRRLRGHPQVRRRRLQDDTYK